MRADRQQQFLEYLLTFLVDNTVNHMPKSRSGHTKVNSCINLSYRAPECILYQLKLPLFWLAALGPLQRNLLLSERMLANKRYNPYLIKKYSIYRKMKALCPIFSPTVSPAQTSTSPLSYLPHTPCFKTRSWSPAKQNWVL